MIDHVWLLTDATTGDLSYVKHGKEGDEPNWKLIGPFAYTQPEAAASAAKNPRFFPEGVEADLSLVRIEASAFVQAIFNGFPPSNTDVFMLDDGIFPLTNAGADWVDEALGHPIWTPLFDGSGTGLDWLGRVLKQIATRLSMNMETVQAIGTINAAAEDDAAEVDQTQVLVMKHVGVAIIPEPETIALERDHGFLLSPAAQFWLHTTGMAMFGLPELEIRNIPCWWVQSGCAELMTWAAYALDHGISEGDELQVDAPVAVTLKVVESDDVTWETKGMGCLRLEVGTVTLLQGHVRHEGGGSKMVH